MRDSQKTQKIRTTFDKVSRPSYPEFQKGRSSGILNFQKKEKRKTINPTILLQPLHLHLLAEVLTSNLLEKSYLNDYLRTCLFCKSCLLKRIFLLHLK